MRAGSKIRALEFLQNFSFMLWEVPNFSLARNAGVRVADMIPVLAPFVGFQAITAPEMTAVTDEINVGNWNHPYKYVNNWGYGTITLSRGCAINRTSFGTWVKEMIDGRAIRRNFVLVHFTRSSLATLSVPLGFARLFTIPGKAWFLEGCQPTRFKAASDFDASSSDISIEEIDIDPLVITDAGASSVSALRNLGI